MSLLSKIPYVGGPDYPVDVVLRKTRSNGKNVRKHLKARRIKERQKGFVYELSNGEKTQPVPYESIDVKDDGTPVVTLQSPEAGKYIPMKWDDEKEKMTPVLQREGAQAFRKNRYNKSRQFYQRKSLLERYQAPITIVIFALAFILMSAGMVNFMDGLAGQFAETLTKAVGSAASSAAGAG